MNQISQSFAGLFLILMLIIFTIGASRFSEWIKKFRKEEHDIREQTDEEKSDNIGKT